MAEKNAMNLGNFPGSKKNEAEDQQLIHNFAMQMSEFPMIPGCYPTFIPHGPPFLTPPPCFIPTQSFQFVHQYNMPTVQQNANINLNTSNKNINFPTFSQQNHMKFDPNDNVSFPKLPSNQSSQKSTAKPKKAPVKRTNSAASQAPQFGLKKGPEHLVLVKKLVNACTEAEKIVLNHQKRPCFKKMDLLCGRLKQELLKNNNVVPNINSQGIVFALKDAILVFTRIVHAFNIVSGYFYNDSAELKSIENALEPGMRDSFLKWQEATEEFIDKLVPSLTNLDHLVAQNSGARKNANKKGAEKKVVSPNKSSISSTESSVDLLDGFIENSEEVQRMHDESGTYLRPGIYNPLQKQKKETKSKDELLLLKIFNDESQYFFENPDDLSPSAESTPIKPLSDLFRMKLHLIEKTDMFKLNELSESGIGDSMKLPNVEYIPQKTWKKIDSNGHARKIMRQILNLDAAEYFYYETSLHDTGCLVGSAASPLALKNLNEIVICIESEIYNSLDEILFDLRCMVKLVMDFFKSQKNTSKMLIVSQFAQDIEKIVSSCQNE